MKHRRLAYEETNDVTRKEKLLGIGHNGGPRLSELSWNEFCWREAHKKVWKNVPREIMLRRLELAEQAGMTYKEYTLEILERGRYPSARKKNDDK
jgi:hypothetical protein